MALKAKDISTIESAIRTGGSIIFEYYPNTTDPRGSFGGDRIIIPLRMFQNNGKFYLFGYWLGGVSASGGGLGYRLYLQKNIYNVRSKNVQIALSKQKVNNNYLKRYLDILLYKNQIGD